MPPNESVRKKSRSTYLIRSSSLVRSAPKKSTMIEVPEKGKRAKASSSEKVPYDKKQATQPALPPFSYGGKKVTFLLVQWAKGRVFALLEVKFHLSTRIKKTGTART